MRKSAPVKRGFFIAVTYGILLTAPYRDEKGRRRRDAANHLEGSAFKIPFSSLEAYRGYHELI